MRDTAPPPKFRPTPLAYVWAGFPMLCAVACLGLFVWLLLGRPMPHGPRLLLEVSLVTGFIVGCSAFASVLGGAALLEEQSDAEPLRFQEAGWILGLPVGVVLALAFLLAQPPTTGGSNFNLYGRPLLIVIAFCATLWGVLTRAFLKREGLTRDDYACAAFLSPVQYAPLARRKHAWRAARTPEKLTLEEARAHMPDIVPALAERLSKAPDGPQGNFLAQLLGNLGEASVAPELLAALESKRYANRRVAAIALGKLGVLEALPALAQHAVADAEASVRRASVVALGKLDSAMATPALIQALADKATAVRQSACVALATLHATEALPALEELARTTKGNVQQAAQKAIERISGQPAEVAETDQAK